MKLNAWESLKIKVRVVEAICSTITSILLKAAAAIYSISWNKFAVYTDGYQQEGYISLVTILGDQRILSIIVKQYIEMFSAYFLGGYYTLKLIM